MSLGQPNDVRFGPPIVAPVCLQITIGQGQDVIPLCICSATVVSTLSDSSDVDYLHGGVYHSEI
jgi:hypothetical protein